MKRYVYAVKSTTHNVTLTDILSVVPSGDSIAIHDSEGHTVFEGKCVDFLAISDTRHLLSEQIDTLKSARSILLIVLRGNTNGKSIASRSRSRDWSFPIYQLDSYESIRPELDALIHECVRRFEAKHFVGYQVSYSIDAASYDDGGTLTLHIESTHEREDVDVDLQTFLEAITSSQNKPACIKEGLKLLARTVWPR